MKRFVVQQGDYALKALQNDIGLEYKGENFDVVTKIDKELERSFYKFLNKTFPEIGFYGEEFDLLRNNKEYVWYLDPIDGTKYYARGVSLWGVSLALRHNNETILGIVYSPTTKELFFADSAGSFLNNKQINGTKIDQLDQTQVFLDLRSYKNSGELINKIAEESMRIRIFGIDSLTLCWISLGFPGVFVKFYDNSDLKNLVDFGAGSFIAEKAGCKVETLKLNESMNILAVGNSGVVDKIGRMILDTTPPLIPPL